MGCMQAMAGGGQALAALAVVVALARLAAEAEAAVCVDPKFGEETQQCGATTARCSCDASSCTTDCCVSPAAVRNACASHNLPADACTPGASPCVALNNNKDSGGRAVLECVDGSAQIAIELGGARTNGYSAFVPDREEQLFAEEIFAVALLNFDTVFLKCDQSACGICETRLQVLRNDAPLGREEDLAGIDSPLGQTCATLCSVCTQDGTDSIVAWPPSEVGAIDDTFELLDVRESLKAVNTAIVYRSRTRGASAVYVDDCASYVTLSLGPDATKPSNQISVDLPFYLMMREQSTIRVAFDNDATCSNNDDLDLQWNYQVVFVRRGDATAGTAFRPAQTSGAAGSKPDEVVACTASPIVTSANERSLIADIKERLGIADGSPDDAGLTEGGSPSACQTSLLRSVNPCMSRAEAARTYGRPYTEAIKNAASDEQQSEYTGAYQWAGRVMAFHPGHESGFGYFPTDVSDAGVARRADMCAVLGPPDSGSRVITLGRSDISRDEDDPPPFAVDAAWEARLTTGAVKPGCIVLELTDVVVIDGAGDDLCVSENPFCVTAPGCDNEQTCVTDRCRASCGDAESGYASACGAALIEDGSDDAPRGCADRPVFAEAGVVSVSQDGDAWVGLDDRCRMRTSELDEPELCRVLYPGCAGVTPVKSSAYTNCDGRCSGNGDCFDLEGTGLTWARYVRLCDAGGNAFASGGDKGGFDLDSVCARNYRVVGQVPEGSASTTTTSTTSTTFPSDPGTTPSSSTTTTTTTSRGPPPPPPPPPGSTPTTTSSTTTTPNSITPFLPPVEGVNPYYLLGNLWRG